jgi:hypothetical protein
MKYNLIALACALLLAAGLSMTVTAGPAQDADTDGVPDSSDNCKVAPNGTQGDSDLDGYGNACDADFDNSNLVAGNDFIQFQNNFNTSAPTYDEQIDLDCSGLVAGNDFIAFQNLFNQPPGPTDLACAGTAPCPATAHVCP